MYAKLDWWQWNLRKEKYMNNFGKIFLLIGKNISRFKDVAVDE